MDEEYREAVLAAVEAVPAGAATTYGDIAEHVGAQLHRGGPRIVGAIMAREGGAVPWWRVVNAAGRPAPHHSEEALRRLRAEHCPVTADGARVDLSRARHVFGTAPSGPADQPESDHGEHPSDSLPRSAPPAR